MTPEQIMRAAKSHASLLADKRARHLMTHRDIIRLSYQIDRRLPNNAKRRALWKKSQSDES